MTAAPEVEVGADYQANSQVISAIPTESYLFKEHVSDQREGQRLDKGLNQNYVFSL